MQLSNPALPAGYSPLPPGMIANVVTCLEMLEAPPSAKADIEGGPAKADLKGAPAKAHPGDADFVLEDWGHASPAEYRDLFRAVGDATMEGWSLHMLGSARLRVGKNDESRPLLRDALRRFRDASDTAGLALTFDDLASQAVADGDLERAARIRGASRRLAAETGAKLATFVEEQFETYFRPNVTTTLDPEALQARMAEGEAWPLEDAIAYALGGDLPTPAAPPSREATAIDAVEGPEAATG